MRVFKNILMTTGMMVFILAASYGVVYMRTSINSSPSFDDSCRECVSVYCSLECDGTGSDCGLCIQKWCSYEC